MKNRRKDFERVLKYVGKEYEEGRPDAMKPVVVHCTKQMTYEELLVSFTKAQGTAQVVAQMIRNGATTEQLLRQDSVSGWMLMNLPRVSSYRTAMTQAADRTALAEWDLTSLRSLSCRSEDAQHCWNVVLSWLDTMIRKPLPHRPRQLWIVSKPGSGKSLLVRHLMKMLRIYQFPKETKYHCLWEADTDLIVADDVMIPIYDFLSWADGTSMTIEKKGGTTRKEHAYPMLVLSNNRPEQMYQRTNPQTLAALAGTSSSRFHVLEWPDTEGLPVSDFVNVRRWEPPVRERVDPYARAGLRHVPGAHRDREYSFQRVLDQANAEEDAVADAIQALQRHQQYISTLRPGDPGYSMAPILVGGPYPSIREHHGDFPRRD